MGNRLLQACHFGIFTKPPRPTQPPTHSGTGNVICHLRAWCSAPLRLVRQAGTQHGASFGFGTMAAIICEQVGFHAKLYRVVCCGLIDASAAIGHG